MNIIHLTNENQDAIYCMMNTDTQSNTAQINTLKKEVRRIIKSDLTQKQKQVIILYYFKGKKMREIGQIMGISVPAVSKHLKKARLAIKRNKNIKKVLNYNEPA